MALPHIAVLGAGPAGVGAAHQLSRRNLATVTVLERNMGVGGNAGSFDLAGLRVDYGSHRLHPACDSDVLDDISALLGDDLLVRPRHGRIRLRGRWIHFPLKPVDLALRLPPQFALGIAGDIVTKTFYRNGASNGTETFASVMEHGLGHTICHDFYFPYARKLWGVEPRELAATQAQRRVSAGSLGKMLRKVLSAVPGIKGKGDGVFFYPKRGYGQISEAYADSAREAGADIRLGATVTEAEMRGDGAHTVTYQQEGVAHTVQADYIWSTIPITILARCLSPAPPAAYIEAANSIDFRAMILVYLVLEQEQFSEYDAHYFPETEIRISRLSEPKNYSDSREPRGRTVLCAEFPCSPDDPEWAQSDAELGQMVCDALERAGIPVQAPVSQVVTRRLRQAYPIYRNGYDRHFEQLDQWISQIDGLLNFGRQGLFAHDNTHHALYMAYSAVECLDDTGTFDRERWASYRHEFESHVVED